MVVFLKTLDHSVNRKRVHFNVQNSIPTLRFRLAAAIAKGLRLCPCCGQSPNQVMNV
jgi:hypothetical protein